MDVHFTPELEKKLNDLAAQSGITVAALVQDAVVSMLDDLAPTKDMLDRRYDEIKSGKVKLISGEAFFENLRQREELLKPRHPDE